MPLKSHGGLSGNDFAILIERDLKGGMIIRSEDSSEVIDADGDK